jgi:hypothetical protein
MGMCLITRAIPQEPQILAVAEVAALTLLLQLEQEKQAAQAS